MNIVVLAGGVSPERNVSLSSGALVAKSLRENGHQVSLMDLFLGEPNLTNVKELFTSSTEMEIPTVDTENLTIEKIRSMRPDAGTAVFGPHVIDACQAADIVFLALHGEDGENGKVQATLSSLGIAYTGCDYLASALSMDKKLSKLLFVENNVPTPNYYSLTNLNQWEDVKLQLTYPCVIKPSNGGSSVGVTIPQSLAEAETGVRSAFEYDDTVLVEEFVKGREFAVGFLDNQILPAIEIIPKTGFYDYKNKYQPNMTEEICPANITPEIQKNLEEATKQAIKALGLSVYGRLDFLLDAQGKVYCLEANTLPGMTPTSLLPQEAAAVGMSFGELCEQIIALSIENCK